MIGWLMQLIDIGQEIHEQCGNPGVATSRNWIANLLIAYKWNNS